MSLQGSRSRIVAGAVSLLIVAFIIPSCSSAGGPDPDPDADKIHVAGTYGTQVTLSDNTCTGVTVMPLPTTVTHAAGATTFSLQHGPLTYSGSLTSAGAFTTAPRVIQDGGTQTTITIAGSFTTTGFIADVTVAIVNATPPNCGYKVHWVGTKTGSPNVIP